MNYKGSDQTFGGGGGAPLLSMFFFYMKSITCQYFLQSGSAHTDHDVTKKLHMIVIYLGGDENL